jgi:beta-lactamase class A
MRQFRTLLLVLLLVSIAITPTFAAAQTPKPSVEIDWFKLNDRIEAILKENGFIKGTTRQGSVYVYHLNTSQWLEVNPDVVYSGASMTKVAVLNAITYNFGKLTRQQATLLAKMIICSENAATNELIKLLGDGDFNRGLEFVNELGESGLVLKRPYSDDGSPVITDGPVDPKNADADPNNFATVRGIGVFYWWFVGCQEYEIVPYSCKINRELLRANVTNNLIEGGVPEGTLVAHKHGWTQDTHGDAAYIESPGGKYVLTIILHQRKFLQSKSSFYTISEISRAVYNAFNPTNPMQEIRSQPIPKDCKVPPEIINRVVS